MIQCSGLPRMMTTLLRRLRRLSFRTKLVAAFIVLITSSALATIFIADAVFGQTVLRLATSKVDFYLKAAEQMFQVRLERLRMAACAAGNEFSGFSATEPRMNCLLEEIRFDFALLLSEEKGEIHRFPLVSDVPLSISEDQVAELLGSTLCTLIEKANIQGSSVAGLAVLPAAEARLLGYDDPPDRGMYMLASLPSENGRSLILGAMLNRSMDILGSPSAFLSLVDASIFLDDVRISSILGPEALGTHADPAVAERVLRDGQTFVGRARVVDRNYFAAYTPLRDSEQRIIGMLGIGTDERAYQEVRSRTISLFACLIAAGMLFGFAITYLFAGWLMRPIAQLAVGMNRVAGGDLDYKLRLHSADELGKVAHAFNLMVKAVKQRDMKLREITEARLSQVEKEVSIGRLAAGVAHEINNPLTAVLSLSGLMLRHLPEQDERAEDLDIIVKETTRCREIVRGLLDFARESPTELQVIDVNQVLETTLSLAKKLERMETVAWTVELSSTPLYVDGDAKQLQQVFTNIIINAAEAAGEKGRVWIHTDEDSSGGFVVIEVEDSGSGIPDEYRTRVFEPFFTTKGVGKGTGLGLSVSLGIVQKHHGEIELESREGLGTKVTVMLPRADELAPSD